MGNLIHFLNGKFVSEDKLLISPRDLGYVRGYAVADFLITNHHRPFKLSEHIDRLLKSAEVIELQVPWNKTQITAWVNETLAKNDQETEKTIKIILSGGQSHSMSQAEPPTIVIIIDPYLPQPASYYEKGVKAQAVKYKRPYPESKTTYYIEVIRQMAKIKNNAVTEIIYYDDSQVYEAARSNIFAVINNKLVTIKSDIVEGITRNVLLEILRLPIPVEVRDFTFDELLKASEVFLTGSSKKIRGVVEINGKKVGDGKVGKITKEVSKQFEKYLLNNHKN